MELRLGADVMGTDGKLGELNKVIADANRDRITELVVKGEGFRGREHVVPLRFVQRVDGDIIYLDVDKETFEGKAGVVDALHGVDSDYTGPPSMDQEGSFRGNLDYDTATASGGQMQGKPGGYPGGEQLTPDIHDRPAISLGMDILSNLGDKVGEVAELSFSSEDGSLVRLVLKRPLIARRDPHVELPVTWVKDLAVDGILLNVGKSDIDNLLEANAAG
ncbi:MAG: PRC-barrel domain-containing protein [Dehalococcoidia bacterium]